MTDMDLNFELKERNVKVVIGGDVPELVSGFGRYQLFQCSLVLVPIIFTSMSNTNFVFAVSATKYRCVVPQCEFNSTTLFPPDWWPKNVTDYKCSQPIFIDNSTCDPNNIVSTATCGDWIYEDYNSLISEFELSCDEFKGTMISTIHNLGVLVGMPITGYISDRWGRRNAIILNSLSLCIGAIKPLTGTGGTGYIQYVIIEFIEAVLVTGTYTSGYVLLVELIGTNKRIIAATIMGISINAGEILLSFIAWSIPYWRHFLLVIYCPGALFIIYIFFLEESMRWLLTNRKSNKAIALLEKIAKWNRFVVPDKMRDPEYISTDGKEVTRQEEFNFNLLFEHPIMFKRLLVCAWWWFSVSLVYYGLTFSSVALPGNKFTNFALSGMFSVPGEVAAVLVLNRIGRKKTLIIGYVVCGLCCIAIGFLSKDYKIVQLIIFLIGKMFISMCFNVVYVYTSELMPTSARASLMGICSMIARIGSVLSPLALLLSQQWVALPSILFGCSSLLAALLALTTPETLRRQLPDTIAQATALN